MAGRNQPPSAHSQHALRHQLIALAEDPLLRRCDGPPPPIENRIALLQRDLHSLLIDNQRLAATHVALKQELTSTDQERSHLLAISHKIKAERDADVREVLDRSLKVEAEYRPVEAIKTEISVVREDVERLRAENEELRVQLGGLNGEVKRARAERRCLQLIRAETESLGIDMEKGRAALEVERKNRMINLQYEKEMEKNQLLAIKEIESLRAKLAEVLERKRARETAVAAAANPGCGYGTMNESPGVVYEGGSYPVQYPMNQVQSPSGSGSSSGSGSLSEYDSISS